MQIPKMKKHCPPDKRYHRNLNTIYLNFDEFGATLFIFQAHPTPRCLQEFEKNLKCALRNFMERSFLLLDLELWTGSIFLIHHITIFTRTVNFTSRIAHLELTFLFF